VHSAIPLKVNIYTPKELELLKYIPHVEDGAASGDVSAPMSGAVEAVSVKAGDRGNVGQELGILEAMKIRNVLKTDKSCTIKKVNVAVGQCVSVDDAYSRFIILPRSKIAELSERFPKQP